jgi:hypothetical protein
MNNLEEKLVKGDSDQRDLQGYIMMKSSLMSEIFEKCEKLHG